MQKLKEEEKNKLGIPKIDLKIEDLDSKPLLLFSLEDVKKLRIVAFKLEKRKLKVALENVDSKVLDFLESFKKENHLGIELFLTSKESIDKTLKYYEKIKDKGFKEPAPFSNYSELFLQIIKKALSCGAFKINTEFEGKEGVKIYYQVKGLVITSKENFTNYKNLVLEIKKMANLETEESNISQKGRFSIVFENKKVDLAVLLLPLPKGEKLTIEILAESPNIYSLSNLGVGEAQVEVLKKALNASHGIILVTGPQGSGRSATMYAILLELLGKDKKIFSLESLPECVIFGINQTQVNPKRGITFASGLKKILEEEPDLIMIEGMRDLQTVDMVVHQALSEKSFIASLDSKSAFLAPFNLIDIGIEPLLVASSLNAVLNQRLALRLCDHCKEEQALKSEFQDIVEKEIEALPFHIKHSIIKLQFYNTKGCSKCENTGFKGRIGIFEILKLDKDIKDLVAQKASTEDIKKSALEKGMITLRQDGILKALNGLTTLDEVFRLTS